MDIRGLGVAAEDVELLFAAGEMFHVGELNLYKWDTVVFEGAQGYRLDEVMGTIPHTTYSNTTPLYALEHCKGADVRVIGVTRSYETRHGNGPMCKEGVPCHDLREHNNGGFAGELRSGLLDAVSIVDAAEKCSVTEFAVNHLDFMHLSDKDRDVLSSHAPITIVGHGPTWQDKIEAPGKDWEHTNPIVHEGR